MIHLVTGGSGSGKSAYAEQCILDFGGTRRVYIATMQPFGAEGQMKYLIHPGREKRGRRRKFLRAFPVWPIRRGIWFW